MYQPALRVYALNCGKKRKIVQHFMMKFGLKKRYYIADIC